MGLEDKELGDDLITVNFFMEKDGNYTMFETEHVISQSDVICKISSPRCIQKSRSQVCFIFDL